MSVANQRSTPAGAKVNGSQNRVKERSFALLSITNNIGVNICIVTFIDDNRDASTLRLFPESLGYRHVTATAAKRLHSLVPCKTVVYCTCARRGEDFLKRLSKEVA